MQFRFDNKVQKTCPMTRLAWCEGKKEERNPLITGLAIELQKLKYTVKVVYINTLLLESWADKNLHTPLDKWFSLGRMNIRRKCDPVLLFPSARAKSQYSVVEVLVHPKSKESGSWPNNHQFWEAPQGFDLMHWILLSKPTISQLKNTLWFMLSDL